MKNQQVSILYSPTDLIRFMESPFASWMERLHLEEPTRAIPDEKTDDAELIAKTCDQHEERFLRSPSDEGSDIALPNLLLRNPMNLIRKAEERRVMNE